MKAVINERKGKRTFGLVRDFQNMLSDVDLRARLFAYLIGLRSVLEFTEPFPPVGSKLARIGQIQAVYSATEELKPG